MNHDTPPIQPTIDRLPIKPVTTYQENNPRLRKAFTSRKKLRNQSWHNRIGIDINDRNARGTFVKSGCKLINGPDFYLRGMRHAHILKGAYKKPEIAFGYYSADFWHYDHDFNSIVKRKEMV